MMPKRTRFEVLVDATAHGLDVLDGQTDTLLTTLLEDGEYADPRLVDRVATRLQVQAARLTEIAALLRHARRR